MNLLSPLKYMGRKTYFCALAATSVLAFSHANAETFIIQKQNTNFAIDGNSGSTQDGLQVYLWDTNSGNVNQQWIEINRGEGYYSYQKTNTTLCLDGGNGGARRQAVILWSCGDDNYNQHWRKVSLGDNRFRLEKRNSPEFSIDGNVGGAQRQGIYLWDSNSGNVNQQWVFTALGGATPTPTPTATPEPPVGGLWSPQPFESLTWDWYIGAKPNASTVAYRDVYDIDLFDNSAADIKTFQDRGMTVICYFSAGTFEGWRPDWREYFSFITGETYTGSAAPFLGNMSEWDERWLDIRRVDLLEPIMRGRMKMAKEKGCDAVEPDNMDSYTNLSEVSPTGAYTYDDQIVYNRAIADWAHDEGLSVGLKNDVDQLDDLVDYFDWALNEQCYQYNECDGYEAFINQNKAVFGVEYSGDISDFCADANSAGYYWLKKTLALTASRTGCEDY